MYHGHELTPVYCTDGSATLRFSIEALGFGAILSCLPNEADCIPTPAYMEERRHMTRRELRDYGFTCRQCSLAGFSAKDLLGCFTVQQLASTGKYKLRELKEAGCPALQLMG